MRIQSEIQKHSGMLLDSKADFKEHVQNVINKFSKTIGLLRKFQQISQRSSLITIYKLFIKLHIDYGGITYDQAKNVSFPSIPFQTFSETGVHSVQCRTSNNRNYKRDI